jgi:hypothetical protein
MNEELRRIDYVNSQGNVLARSNKDMAARDTFRIE